MHHRLSRTAKYHLSRERIAPPHLYSMKTTKNVMDKYPTHQCRRVLDIHELCSEIAKQGISFFSFTFLISALLFAATTAASRAACLALTCFLQLASKSVSYAVFNVRQHQDWLGTCQNVLPMTLEYIISNGLYRCTILERHQRCSECSSTCGVKSKWAIARARGRL